MSKIKELITQLNKESKLCEISEMVKVADTSQILCFTNSDPTITVCIDPNNHVSTYFKAYFGSSVSKSKLISRISLIKPEYVIHSNSKKELKNHFLSKNEIKQLIKFLSSKRKGEKYTIYQKLIETHNKIYSNQIDINGDMPDYSLLNK